MVLVRDQYHLRTPKTKLLTKRTFICPKGRESSDKGQSQETGRGRRGRRQGKGEKVFVPGRQRTASGQRANNMANTKAKVYKGTRGNAMLGLSV